MTSAPTQERQEKVQAAVEKWVNQMVDFSGNNRLLFYRELKSGTLNISTGTGTFSEEAVVSLCHGAEVHSDRLITPLPESFASEEEQATAAATFVATRKDMAKRLSAVRRKGLANHEERGINTLFLGDGALTWRNDDGQAVPNAPILLTPIEITERKAGAEEFVIRPLDTPELNPTLVVYLSQKQGINLDGDAVLEEITDAAGNVDRQQLRDRILKVCESMPEVAVLDSVVIGNFSYTNLPMVLDLQANIETLASHNMVAAIAGVKEAIEGLRSQYSSDIAPSLPDSQAPAEEFLVLDADSSQHMAINRGLRGESFVIQGPPGTGKSQTIANLIASLTSDGKHVLFVAEKGAAIDAVKKNLTRSGLGEVMMDLHGTTVTKSLVAKMLQSALQKLPNAPVPNTAETFEALERTRGRLEGHTRAIHTANEDFGITYFEARERSLLHPPVPLRPIPANAVSRLNASAIDDAARSVAELADLGRGKMLSDRSPWAHGSLRNGAAADDALERLGELRSALVNLQNQQQAFYAAVQAEPDSTFDEMREALGVSTRFDEAAAPFASDAVGMDLKELHQDLEPIERPAPRRAVASLFNSRYRSAKKKLRAITPDSQGKPAPESRGLVKKMVSADSEFRSRFGSAPKRVGDDSLSQALEQIEHIIERFRSETALILDGLSPDEVDSGLRALEHAGDDAHRLPMINQLEERLKELGLLEIAHELLQTDAPAELVASSLRASCLAAVGDRIEATVPEIASFTAATHRRANDEFQQSDLQHLNLAAERVQRSVAVHARNARNQHPEQSQFVAKEANKKRRLAPVRKMLETAPDVIGALKPCWAMSPLAVSRLLPATPDFFDVVIFDEASQVQPADAVPAIMRARQVIVAGDTRQLPPTRFFASGDADGDGDDEEDEDFSLTQGFESILDVMNAALPKAAWLQWHYRSRDERLINFSNVHIYDKSLRTFPGVAGHRCIQKITAGPEVGSTTEELLRLVFGHAAETPDRSLGVITTSASTARTLEDLVYQQLRTLDPAERSEFESFFDESNRERFFIKNIERVQGDERDDIILAVDLARGPNGRVYNRLGPLNYEGGERRLNVAVTRARRSVTLCTNFDFEDLSPTSFKSRGASLLREYTRYAEHLGNDLGAEAEEKPAMNNFEIDVQKRLTAAGMKLTPQFGVAGYFIDFVAYHPDDPNCPVLAIEADGATYHSSPTARDRDRLRQQVLEGLGWTFHRIWSTEWFKNPEAEVEQAVRSWKRAKVESDLGLNQPSQPQARPDAPVAGTAAPAEQSASTRRARRPIKVVEGQPITEYRMDDLVRLIRWIESDGRLHTDDELIAVAAKELGYGRKGRRIKEHLSEAIRLHRERSGS